MEGVGSDLCQLDMDLVFGHRFVISIVTVFSCFNRITGLLPHIGKVCWWDLTLVDLMAILRVTQTHGSQLYIIVCHFNIDL